MTHLLAVAPEVWIPGAFAIAATVITTIFAARSSNRAEVMTGFRDLLAATEKDRDQWKIRAEACEAREATKRKPPGTRRPRAN